ncbi:HAD family hydrolase [Streptomyces antimycoticus]|uniref:HAD family hydrolase n=1 Tax=Streptomyces antimycoticus TaxID=68175 RepID=UPI003822C481
MTDKHPPTGSGPAPELMLFDLDGVLMDSLPVMRSAWETVRAELGVQIPFESYAEHLGRPFADILLLLGLDRIAGLAEAYGTAATRFSHLAQPFAGVGAALREIAAMGCRLGVVTSKSFARAVPMVDRLDAPFSIVRTPGKGRGKPAPDTLLLALVDAGTDPSNALYVGDMAVDQEAARRAGLRYAHVDWGYGSPEPEEPTPLILREPAELVDLARTGLAKGSA